MQLRTKVDKVLAAVLVVLMSVMVINVLWQVASRYLLGSPSLFTDELANFLLIWVGLLGAAYAAGQRAHLSIDILPEKLSGAKKRTLHIILGVLTIGFALTIMVIGGIRLVYVTLLLEQASATLRLPLGYVYLVIPVSGLLIIFYTLLDFKSQPK
ncbi:TRAP transporter small permease [Marinoscillum furvescens]|uniref:TRAP-type C4-dicarboxylate transport system permease small subunit n=1 Tax=Marinoscillum furvescens DSM 4134 TaxID=1122208 RepID=A0A3D9L1X1_MARFU|nr:TRAP transporter small permease [Marinoscillum furvescens]RED97396.1 TRAP-type C4-dicarboxylate transport system permease small subunit [Marinoscillum furvescens DSM 4134]